MENKKRQSADEMEIKCPRDVRSPFNVFCGVWEGDGRLDTNYDGFHLSPSSKRVLFKKIRNYIK